MAAKESSNRIRDASLHRATEGLRVAEDVCRFHWNLAGLARELKELRHELLALFGSDRGLRAAFRDSRDVQGDVGRGSAPAEAIREPRTLVDLAERNISRAREALRTLEEVCRLSDLSLSRSVEALRYRVYGLERACLSLGSRDRARIELGTGVLYLIACERQCRLPVLEAVREAIRGGVRIVQLREKGRGDRDLLTLARRMREVTAESGCRFVVNDRPDIAVLCHADGVHVGQDDLTPSEARAIVGENALVGLSTHSVAQARQGALSGADYIGLGPMFPTRTKDAGTPLGPGVLDEVLHYVDLPVFAVGGIGPENVGSLVAAGARGIAVSSALLAASDVAETAQRLLASLASAPRRAEERP